MQTESGMERGKHEGRTQAQIIPRPPSIHMRKHRTLREGKRDSRDRSFSSRRRALATFLRPPLQTPAMSWWSRVCLYLMAFTQPRPTMHSAPLSAVFSSLSSRRTDADAATGHPPVSRATSFYDLFQCRENERTDDAEERIGGTETRAPSWNGPLTECTGDVPAEGAS